MGAHKFRSFVLSNPNSIVKLGGVMFDSTIGELDILRFLTGGANVGGVNNG